jgi:hypothetical protein
MTMNFRTKNEWGIEGYHIPTFNAYLDKVKTLKMSNTKKKTYIDDIVKAKEFIPAPQSYETAGTLLSKNRSNLSKGQRVTLAIEIEKDAKKNEKPGPGAYEV